MGLREKVRTGPGGEIDLQIGGELYVRLKENTEIQIRRPHLLEKRAPVRLFLERGALLGTIRNSKQVRNFQILTPVLEVSLRKGIFQVRSRPETRESWVGVLSGTTEVFSRAKRKPVLLRDHEKTQVKGKSAPFKASAILEEDWAQMKEAYAFFPADPEFEERQSRLVKEAGPLFRSVTQEEVLFDPHSARLERTYAKDPASGKVELKIEYDVFPSGSFAAMVFKTQDLDLGNLSRLSFQARSGAEENSPDSFRVEIKSGQKVLLTFHPRRFDPDWRNFEYAFQFPEGTAVSEIAFVFSNQTVGPRKKGAVYLRELAIR